MLGNLLDAFTLDALKWGGFTFILGVAVVFFGMIVLVLSVSLMGKIMTKVEEAKKERSKPTKTVEITKVEESSLNDDIPEHIKVAIIAAISAYYSDSGVKNEFKVKKIKRI